MIASEPDATGEPGRRAARLLDTSAEPTAKDVSMMNQDLKMNGRYQCKRTASFNASFERRERRKVQRNSLDNSTGL